MVSGGRDDMGSAERMKACMERVAVFEDWFFQMEETGQIPPSVSDGYHNGIRELMAWYASIIRKLEDELEG